MPKLRGARTPTHSGSWYEENPNDLSTQIRNWLDRATVEDLGRVRAVIAPHAGYRYCGHVMAYAYKYIVPSKVKRVFLLGPSHHFFSRECHLSPHARYSTPLGDAHIDTEIYSKLHATEKFPILSPRADEAEHSLELHMPYLMEVMRGHKFSLVSIVVGALTPDGEAQYGEILAPYLQDPENFFIISSDFCHWGSRFNYTYYQNSHGDIHQSIKALDHEGMRIIETGDPEAFTNYLSTTGNTICGRHPIGLFLQAAHRSDLEHSIKFTQYDQSHQCLTQRDSSVSYASAAVSIFEDAVGDENGKSSVLFD